jgi:hypothetical protein
VNLLADSFFLIRAESVIGNNGPHA